MPASSTTPAGHLPLKAAHHLALLLLAQEPTYGVALLERLEARSNGAIRLNAGSLYRMIAQLVDAGLVEPTAEPAVTAELEATVAAEPTPAVGAPRKLYGVTALGRAVLRAEAERQAGLLDMARDLDLLERER